MKQFLPITVVSLMAATSLNVNADDKVLNLNNAYPAISYNEAGVWSDCYNEKAVSIDVDIFSLTHQADVTYKSYSGFCPSKVGDNSEQTDWTSNQWGCMAGGGIKVDENGNVMTDDNGKVLVDNGNPYLVGYWSYYNEVMSDNDDDYTLQILLSSETALSAKEIYICNAPWSYYNVMKTGSYTRSFNQKDDKFILTIHAIDEEYNYDNTKTIDVVLGESIDNGDGTYTPSASSEWQKIDLTSLGKVHGVYFTMSSTDSAYGWMNTASYFCSDRFTVTDNATSAITTVEQEANAVAPIYYNLNGTRVNGNALTSGIYVKVVGNKATKVRIK
jgi:hypothetical protein